MSSANRTRDRVGATTAAASTTTSTSPRMRASALLPAGSELVLAADQRVCASMSRVGDTFTTRITEDVVGPIGVVIPKGTVATAQVSSVKNDFDVDVGSLTFGGHTYSIDSDVTYAEVEKVRRKSRSARPVLVGTGLGAAVGGVIGRDVKSAVIGAAGGALAGAIAATQVTKADRCVPAGGRINTKLSEPLKIALTE